MMPATNDVLTPTEFALGAFETAREPKQLHLLPGGQFDAYVDGFDISSERAIDWFLNHLTGACS